MGRFTGYTGAIPTDGQQIALTSNIGPGNQVGDPYGMVYAQNMVGGLRTVGIASDLTNTTVIPAEMRQEGMIVYVATTGAYWQLERDLLTWTQLIGVGGTSQFLRRRFQNATSVTVFNVNQHPVVDIWFESSTPIIFPAIYNLEDGVYGEDNYNLNSVFADGINNDATNANTQITYIVALDQVVAQFDSPKSGTIVVGF